MTVQTQLHKDDQQLSFDNVSEMYDLDEPKREYENNNQVSIL